MSGKMPLADLRARIRALEGFGPAHDGGALAFGVAAIDCCLPMGGLGAGGLGAGGLGLGRVHEVAADGPDRDGPGQVGAGQVGAGQVGAATGFVVALLARLGQIRSGAVLWCSRRPDLDGPGLADAGLDPARLILVQAPDRAGLLWAMEEGLRCRALAAVVGETIGAIDLATSRRLQLAAEAGGTFGLVLDAGGGAAGTVAANALATRWRVAARPAAPTPEGIGIGRAHWRIALWRCRGGGVGSWDVEWQNETHDFALVTALADRPRDAQPVGPSVAKPGVTKPGVGGPIRFARAG
jgi:protein ImuA